MKYFILLLLFFTGCKSHQKLCPREKGYSRITHLRYAHLQYSNLTDIYYNDNDYLLYRDSTLSKRVKGFYGTRDVLGKKSRRRSVSLTYYDTCKTKIKEVHRVFPHRTNRHGIHVFYNQQGVKTKKIIISNKKPDKTITWPMGKRTVAIKEKRARMY